MYAEKDSLVYKQFAKGFDKDDAAAMEYYLSKITDLILVIPLKVDIDSSTNNMFLHYLNHEDWFEAAPLSPEETSQMAEGDLLKVQNKDLEPPSIQDAKDKPNNIRNA